MGKSKRKKSKKPKQQQKLPEKSMDDMTNEELNALLIPANSILPDDYDMGNLIY